MDSKHSHQELYFSIPFFFFFVILQAFQIKSNISRFSGFVWNENEVRKWQCCSCCILCWDFLFFFTIKSLARSQFAYRGFLCKRIYLVLQEKQKNKVKEKFDKCHKDKLIEFCDVLDIQISRGHARKVCHVVDILILVCNNDLLYGSTVQIYNKILVLFWWRVWLWFNYVKKMTVQEDIVAKLIDFLEAPYATTEVLLSEKEKVCKHN